MLRDLVTGLDRRALNGFLMDHLAARLPLMVRTMRTRSRTRGAGREAWGIFLPAERRVGRFWGLPAAGGHHGACGQRGAHAAMSPVVRSRSKGQVRDRA